MECDAGVMDGLSGAFGAVGAVTGLRNPSLAALRVMEEGRQGLLCLGRIPPMCVGGCMCGCRGGGGMSVEGCKGG